MSYFSNIQLKGVFYITVSAVAFGSYGIWSKLMGTAFGDWSQGWIRGLLILLIIVPVGILKKSYRAVEKKDLIWFFIFSLGGLNQAPIFYAFHNLTIGTATVLFYAALVIMGYLMGFLVFREHIGKLKALSLFLALCGIVSLFQLSLSVDDIIPAITALLAGGIAGVEITITKKISNRYSTLSILTSVFVVMVVGNIVPSTLLSDPIPPLSEYVPWFAQLGYVCAMLIAMYTVVRGFQYLAASTGSLIGLSEILFAAVFGAVIFKETLTLNFIISSMCVITAAALPYVRK